MMFYSSSLQQFGHGAFEGNTENQNQEAGVQPPWGGGRP